METTIKKLFVILLYPASFPNRTYEKIVTISHKGRMMKPIEMINVESLNSNLDKSKDIESLNIFKIDKTGNKLISNFLTTLIP